MLRHLRQWSKNFGFGSALSHNSGTANTILFTIQTFNERSRMAKLSQPYLRGHMRWNVTSLQIQLGLIGTYNFGRLSTLKSNILSTRKLRALAAAAGRKRRGHGHAVTTKFWVGEDWGFRQPNPPTPKIYFLLGFLPLNLKNVENQNVNTCPFYVDCTVFASQFRGFRL